MLLLVWAFSYGIFWKGAAAVTQVRWGGCKEVQRARV